jgi:hypothetical protein
VKPPLRELVVDRDLARADVPEDDLAFLRELGGPALLRLAGRDPSRVRIVSTLLHGNEPSGLRAMIRFLRSGDLPATDVLFYIGAVGTALADSGFVHRALPGERDANRCWMPPFDTPQGDVAQRVLERLRSAEPECLVDLHNNTGHNPAYGVAFRVGHAELSLVSLFADRIVHTPIELGTLVEATVPEFPSVTIECGRAGDPAADEAAWRGLRRYLDWDQIDFERPVVPLLLLEAPVRICVRPGIELAFGERAHPSVPLTISRDIDRHNFERLPPGSAIGWVRDDVDWPIEAVGADGDESSRALFEVDGGVLRTRREFIPIMMTTNEVIAKSDCLFYAVQAAPEPVTRAPAAPGGAESIGSRT